MTTATFNLDALAIFERDLVVDGLSPRTATNYRYAALRFLRQMNRPLTEIGSEQVREYLYLNQRTPGRRGPRAASTVFNQLKAIRAFNRWLIRRGELQADSTQGIKGPRPRDRVIEARAPDEVRKLVQAAQGYGRSRQLQLRNAALVALAFDTGCRISELLGLNVGDVLHGKAIADHVRVRGKGGYDRFVAVNELPRRALSDYLAARFDLDPDRPLFTDQDGGRLTYVGARNMLQRLSEIAGAKINWHDARRTAHTLMRLNGVGELDLQTIGGWRTARMVTRYTRAATTINALKAHRANSPLALALDAGRNRGDGQS